MLRRFLRMIVVSGLLLAVASPSFAADRKLPQAAVCENVAEKPVQSFTTRAPIGHTHTCANGHTWDHTANPSYTCQFCGLSQYVQDSVPRPVTVEVANPSAAAPLQTYTLPSASSGGCANGQCSPGRTGWYPGRLLGR